MAGNDRTFTLIGTFDDRITSKLESVNNSLAQLKNSIKRSTQDLSKLNSSFARSAASANAAAGAFAQFNKSATRSLKGLSTEVERSRSSMYALGRSLDFSDGIAGARTMATALKDMERTVKSTLGAMEDLNAASGGGGRRRRGGGGGGGGPSEPETGFFGKKDGYTVAKGYAANMLSSISNKVAEVAWEGIGAALNFVKKKVGQAVSDELMDYATAGGLKVLSKGQLPFIATFERAQKVQREMDQRMAVAAAALPGDTDMFVLNAKQLSDTLTTAMVQAPDEFVKQMTQMSKELSAVSKKGVTDQKSAYMYALEQLTSFSTITDVITPSGGISATMLIEQIMNQDQYSVNELRRRYNAVKRNPLLAQGLAKYEDEINKYSAGSLEKLTAVLRMFSELYPAEVLAAFQNSVEGTYESIVTYISSMEAGLLGLKRSFSILVDNTLVEGQTLYNVFRDIFVGLGKIITPFLQYLPNLWDPMKNIAKKFGHIWFALKETSNVFDKAFAEFSELETDPNTGGLSATVKSAVKATLFLARWAGGDLAAIADLEGSLKGLKFKDLGSAIMKSLNILFSSKFADDFGQAIGSALGEFLADISRLFRGELFGKATKGLTAGFSRGFGDSGGLTAIKDLLGLLVTTIFNVIKDVTLTALIKAPIATLGLAAVFSGFLSQLLSVGADHLITAAKSYTPKGKPTALPSGAGPRSKTHSFMDLFAPTEAMKGARDKKLKNLSKNMKNLRKNTARTFEPWINYAKTSGAAQRVQKFSQSRNYIPAGAVGTGMLMGATALATGSSIGDAAALTIKSVLGGAIGSIFGPVGTMIGSTAGPAILDYLGGLFVAAFDQKAAAAEQMKAAQMQINAATSSARDKYGKFGPDLGGLEALNQAFGGAAGLNKYVNEQIALGTMTEKQAEPYRKVAQSLLELNTTTEAVKKAHTAYENAVNLKTGQEEENKRKLEAAVKAQEEAMKRASANWVGMDSSTRIKILSSADGIVAALDGAAKRIRAWQNPIPGITPNTKPSPIPGLVPRTTDTPADRPRNTQLPPNPNFPWFGPVANGSLGDAIRYEMKHKPFGSDLLIANSSETVIPAAKGYGMKDFMGGIEGGFRAVYENLKSLGLSVKITDKNNEKRADETDKQITNYHNETQAQIAAISKNVASLSSSVAGMSNMGGPGGIGGALFGAGGGGVARTVQVGRMLQGMGLNVAENPYFGTGRVGKHAPNSYHYVGRAIDVTGPEALLDQAYARLKAMGGYSELFWKSAGHYDHLHVAYALGLGSPILTNNKKLAQQIDARALGRANIETYTAGKGEFGGGTNVYLGGVTVNADGIRDPDQVAYIVAQKIGQAVRDAESGALTLNYY